MRDVYNRLVGGTGAKPVANGILGAPWAKQGVAGESPEPCRAPPYNQIIG